MLVAAAVCPHPPLLLPGLTGASDAGAELRGHCLAALSGLVAAQPDRMVVVGGDVVTGVWPQGSVADGARFGGLRRPGAPLPLSLSVGRTLLDAAAWTGPVAWQAVSWSSAADECAALGSELASGDERTAMLVMGDGSARRGLKAPGYVDDRAHAYDDQAARALAEGDASALLRLDPDLGAELLVQGRAAWQVLAGAVGERPVDGRLLHAADPWGVLYLVASWGLT